MNVVIVGGGKVGSYLASLLLDGNHDVRIVENRPHVLARLHRELPTEAIVDGDGARRETLDLARADRADVLVTVTGDDEVNLTIALMAKTFYKIPRVIGRINNPRNAWLFTPEMGVDVAVNQTDLLAKLILEEMSLGDMMVLLRLRKGEISLVTEKLEPGAPAEGKRVADLPLPKDCLLVGAIRDNDILVPRGDTVLRAHDEILALVRTGSHTAFRNLLANPARAETPRE
ncbi:MAG: NAD-binding protein [Anaerolineales bacterium]